MGPFLLLALLAGTAVVVATAKNVRGETIATGRRRISGQLGEPTLAFDETIEFNAWNDYWDIGQGPERTNIAEGDTGTRKGNLLRAIAEARKEASSALSSPPMGVSFDFFDDSGIIFRVTVLPAKGKWLLQVLDPRATVQLLKIYKQQADAIVAGYDFVNKKGY